MGDVLLDLIGRMSLDSYLSLSRGTR